MKRKYGIGAGWSGMWNGRAPELCLGELMRLIPIDELVIICPLLDGRTEYQRKDALFDGTAGDWWKEAVRSSDMHKMDVVGIRAWELEDTAGPVTMIVVEL